MIENRTDEFDGIGLTFLQSKILRNEVKEDAFSDRQCEEWRRIVNEVVEGEASILSNYVTFPDFFSQVN